MTETDLPTTSSLAARISWTVLLLLLTAGDVACLVINRWARAATSQPAAHQLSGDPCTGTVPAHPIGLGLQLTHTLDTIRVVSWLSALLAVLLIVWCIWRRRGRRYWALPVVALLALTVFALFNVVTAETTKSLYLDTPSSCPPATMHVPAK